MGTIIIPPLRMTEESIPKATDEEKAEILGTKFFPRSGQADLSDIDATQTATRFDMEMDVTNEELGVVIRRLPNRKAPGLDSIINEV